MIDVLSILAEPVHHRAKIPNMFCRYNIFAYYVDGNIINIFELLMCSKNNELSFFIIDLQHILGHPIPDLFNTSFHLTNAVILSKLHPCRPWFEAEVDLLVICIKMVLNLIGTYLTKWTGVESK